VITLLDTITGIFSSLSDFAQAVGNFTHALNQRQTYIRLASVVLGILLIALVLWPRYA